LPTLQRYPEHRGDIFLQNFGNHLQDWHYYPEDHNPHLYCCENLKSHEVFTISPEDIKVILILHMGRASSYVISQLS
jgi:hypothetical protein